MFRWWLLVHDKATLILSFWQLVRREPHMGIQRLQRKHRNIHTGKGGEVKFSIQILLMTNLKYYPSAAKGWISAANLTRQTTQ